MPTWTCAETMNSGEVLLAVDGNRMRTQIFLPMGAMLVKIVTWGKIYSMVTTSRGNMLMACRSDTIQYYVLEEKTNHLQR
jgi:hypothetical protein